MKSTASFARVPMTLLGKTAKLGICEVGVGAAVGALAAVGMGCCAATCCLIVSPGGVGGLSDRGAVPVRSGAAGFGVTYASVLSAGAAVGNAEAIGAGCK